MDAFPLLLVGRDDKRDNTAGRKLESAPWEVRLPISFNTLDLKCVGGVPHDRKD